MTIVGVPLPLGAGSEDTSLTGIRSKIADIIDRTDLDTQIVAAINAVIRRIERRYNLNYMKYQDDGQAFAAGAYELAIPDRFKRMILMKWSQGNRFGKVSRADEEWANRYYPDLVNDVGYPEIFVSRQHTSKFLIRPTADGAYTVFQHYYRYSLPLSIGVSETHWLLDNFQEVIVYGACLEMMPIIKDWEREQTWFTKMKSAMNDLRFQEQEEATDDNGTVEGAYASN